MTTLLVFSNADAASANMHAAFLTSDTEEVLDSVSTVTVEKEPVQVVSSDLPQASLYIFLSRHVGKQPCITVHSVGNPNDLNLLGGAPNALGYTAPSFILSFLTCATPSAPIQVVMEVTHHGPTDFSAPVVFVEVGGSTNEWADTALTRYAMEKVIESLKRPIDQFTPAVAFGGPHYASLFTRYSLLKRYAIGHIVSKYAFERGVSEEVLTESIEKSIPRPTALLVDRNGLRGEDRRRVEGLARISKLDIIRL
jgi:D-aminoacyl-tRNA deacylase